MYIHHSFIIVIVVGSLKYTKKVVFYSLQQCRKVYLDLGEIQIIIYSKAPPDRRTPSPDQERRHGPRMAPPPAQERFGYSSRRYERDYERISPQRRHLTRRERLEMDLEMAINDDSASANSYDDEPMHRPPPLRYQRDYPPLPTSGT